MNHAQLAITVLDDLTFYLILYLSLLLGYLVLYRKIYWGLSDPMIWTVTNMTGGAFCVFFLYEQDQLAPLYKWSFLTTELALFLGLYLSRYIPVINFGAIFQSEPSELTEDQISEFDVFTWIIGIAYILCEIASIMTVGIVLFEDDVNHVTAFENHGILMAFITSFRFLCPLVLFYKILIRKQKLNYFDIICWFFAVFGLLTTGAKGAILVFFFQYFMLQFPLIYQGKAKPIKMSWPIILGIAAFPVVIISITRGGDTTEAVTGIFIRLLSSGDIFLLGYNDDAMNAITEKSFLKYLFYPGWGTILKNLGFNVSTPQGIGPDLLNYHYNRTNGGPNSRYNYMALHFLGFWGAIIYAAFIGTAIGVVRNNFRNLDVSRINYISYLFLTIIAYFSNLLIDDSMMFSNYIFWRPFFLFLCYLLTKTVCLIIKNRIIELSPT